MINTLFENCGKMWPNSVAKTGVSVVKINESTNHFLSPPMKMMLLPVTPICDMIISHKVSFIIYFNNETHLVFHLWRMYPWWHQFFHFYQKCVGLSRCAATNANVDRARKIVKSVFFLVFLQKNPNESCRPF